MLAYVLALVVGFESFALYMAAFFFPEVHRKNDVLWSGVGMFYALVLWVCAGRITGGLLLGQTASVILLGWLGWQTLALRRQVAPFDQQTPLPDAEQLKSQWTQLSKTETLSGAAAKIKPGVDRLKTSAQGLAGTIARSTRRPQPVPAEEPYVPLTREDFASASRDRAASMTPEAAQAIPPETPRLDESRDRASVRPAKAVPSESAKEKPVEVETPEAVLRERPETARPGDPVAELRKTRQSKPSQKTTPPAVNPEATKAAGGVLGGLFQKREPKPVYVRKQYREDAETTKPEKRAKPKPSVRSAMNPSAPSEPNSDASPHPPVDPTVERALEGMVADRPESLSAVVPAVEAETIAGSEAAVRFTESEPTEPQPLSEVASSEASGKPSSVSETPLDENAKFDPREQDPAAEPSIADAAAAAAALEGVIAEADDSTGSEDRVRFTEVELDAETERAIADAAEAFGDVAALSEEAPAPESSDFGEPLVLTEPEIDPPTDEAIHEAVDRLAEALPRLSAEGALTEDSTSAEPKLAAKPPRPPAANLVEAAIVDAEGKRVKAHPPNGTGFEG